MVRGIERKIDLLGRATLPKEFRKTLGIKPNDPVEIFCYDDGIFIKPVKTCCSICGETTNLRENAGMHICFTCWNDFEPVEECGKFETNAR
jgi:AbrB family looped-hinge helix DNA binding protein